MFYGILAALAAVIVGLDQWTKWLTVTHIPSTNGSAVVRAIPGFFHITHIKNTGAAWSMLEGQTWLFVLVTAAFFAIVGVLIWKKVLQKKFELVCLAMIAGGALGNLIDRVVSGAVTDMIRLEFVNFPVFNVADCFVTTGCALLIVYVLFFDRPKKTPPEQDGKAEESVSGAHTGPGFFRAGSVVRCWGRRPRRPVGSCDFLGTSPTANAL